MTRPPRRSRIAGTRCPISRTLARTFTSYKSVQSAGVASVQPLCLSQAPALFTRMSTAPPASAVAVTFWAPSSVSRSPIATVAAAPLARIDVATAVARALLRPWTTTSAPSVARSLTIASPSPPFDPVTSARLPARRRSTSSFPLIARLRRSVSQDRSGMSGERRSTTCGGFRYAGPGSVLALFLARASFLRPFGRRRRLVPAVMRRGLRRGGLGRRLLCRYGHARRNRRVAARRAHVEDRRKQVLGPVAAAQPQVHRLAGWQRLPAVGEGGG